MRVIKRVLIFTVFIFVFISTGLYFMQERIIFLPTKLESEYIYQFDEDHKEIYLEALDGALLNAVHFTVADPKGVILYFHGNAGDLSRWGVIASEYTKFGYDVLVMDYRTYGKSDGKLSEEALLDDAQLFYDYVSAKYSEENIIVLGRSLGTTFATYVASKNNPAKLILETPFFSMEEMAKNRFPFLPVSYFLRYKFPTNEYITKVSCPITIFHGSDDSVVPYESGEKLSQLVESSQLNFITIPGGEHNDLPTFTDYQVGIIEALH